jgi:hypothetical protein
LSFHFSGRNFRFALLISLKIQLQQNTCSTKVRLWSCVYGHVQGGWAMTFHFTVVRLRVWDLVFFFFDRNWTFTKMHKDFRVSYWWKKTWKHFFYLQSLSVLANLICKWLFLAVGLQHQKIRMCIVIILTCFKSHMLLLLQSFHRVYW